MSTYVSFLCSVTGYLDITKGNFASRFHCMYIPFHAYVFFTVVSLEYVAMFIYVMMSVYIYSVMRVLVHRYYLAGWHYQQITTLRSIFHIDRNYLDCDDW